MYELPLFWFKLYVLFLHSSLFMVLHLQRSIHYIWARLHSQLQVLQPVTQLQAIKTKHASGMGSKVISIGTKPPLLNFHPIIVRHCNVVLHILACLHISAQQCALFINKSKTSLVGGIFLGLFDFPNKVDRTVSVDIRCHGYKTYKLFTVFYHLIS